MSEPFAVKTAEPVTALTVNILKGEGSVPATVNNTALAASARISFGPDYHVIDAGRYLAILHPDLGAAAVVNSNSETEAEKAAAELTSVMRIVGVRAKALPFAIATGAPRPPILVRSGPNMATDIAVSLARIATQDSVIGDSQMRAIMSSLDQSRKLAVKKVATLSPDILNMIDAAVQKVIGTSRVLAGGSEVEPNEVSAPNFLLPALLVSAAQNWAIPVAASKGRGGFTMNMTTDQSAVLMYRVTGIEVSSPLLLFAPIINVIRRQKKHGEFVLDDCITRFGNFMTTHNLDPEGEAQELEVRIAMSD